VVFVFVVVCAVFKKQKKIEKMSAVDDAIPAPLGAYVSWRGENSGKLPFQVRALTGDEVPEPQRSLLVHAHNMTPTLAAFHDSPISLHVLSRAIDQQQDILTRFVLLSAKEEKHATTTTAATTTKVVAFGAIHIHLANLPEGAATEVREEKRPLGSILLDPQYDIQQLCEPQGFFSLQLNPEKQEKNSTFTDWFHLAAASETSDCTPTIAYGRENRITCKKTKQIIAQVVEIIL
jgi:hypothetical protein